MDLIKSLISFYITFRGMSVLRSWILLSHRWRSTPIKSHQLILKIFKTFTHHLHQVINPFLYPTNPLDLNSNINPRPWKASYLLQIQSKSLILLIRSQSWIKNHKTIHFIGQKVYLLFNFNLFKELAGQHSFSISLSLFSFQSYPSSDSKPILSLLLQSQWPHRSTRTDLQRFKSNIRTTWSSTRTCYSLWITTCTSYARSTSSFRWTWWSSLSPSRFTSYKTFTSLRTSFKLRSSITNFKSKLSSSFKLISNPRLNPSIIHSSRS